MKNRKAIFFTSDWHVNHVASLKFDNRPFKDVDEMHRALVKRYNAIVPEDGVCYFLGDMGFGNPEVLSSILKELNGTKVLVLGNHDKNMFSSYNVGFDVVVNSVTLYIANERVTLSHCPLRGLYREDTTDMKGAKPGDLWHGESKQQRFSVTNEGQFHGHGHIHSPNGGKSKKILGRQFDVGVPANNYTPVPYSQFESFIVKTLQKEKQSGNKDKLEPGTLIRHRTHPDIIYTIESYIETHPRLKASGYYVMRKDEVETFLYEARVENAYRVVEEP